MKLRNVMQAVQQAVTLITHIMAFKTGVQGLCDLLHLATKQVCKLMACHHRYGEQSKPAVPLNPPIWLGHASWKSGYIRDCTKCHVLCICMISSATRSVSFIGLIVSTPNTSSWERGKWKAARVCMLTIPCACRFGSGTRQRARFCSECDRHSTACAPKLMHCPCTYLPFLRAV